MGRGGGPTYLAIQSQAPGSVEGMFRITEQGEMVQVSWAAGTIVPAPGMLAVCCSTRDDGVYCPVDGFWRVLNECCAILLVLS